MKKVCSFCGRSEREVRLLITGINGYICENCAEQAFHIVQENLTDNTAKSAAKGKYQQKKYGTA